MTISLTNRVSISVGISNLTAATYWQQVYSSLGLSMATETSSFLHSQDIFRTYRKQYAGRTDIKSKRAKNNNMKIKELMEQQIKDIKRGVTYKSGCAIDSNDAPEIKSDLPILWLLCTGTQNHRCQKLPIPWSKKSGSVEHYHQRLPSNFISSNYGEFNKGSSRTHPVVPTALFQIDYCLFTRGL